MQAKNPSCYSAGAHAGRDLSRARARDSRSPRARKTYAADASPPDAARTKPTRPKPKRYSANDVGKAKKKARIGRTSVLLLPDAHLANTTACVATTCIRYRMHQLAMHGCPHG